MERKLAGPIIFDKSFIVSCLLAVSLCLVFWYAVYKLVTLVIS